MTGRGHRPTGEQGRAGDDHEGEDDDRQSGDQPTAVPSTASSAQLLRIGVIEVSVVINHVLMLGLQHMVVNTWLIF
jgi:hypothetical protein